jgi:hypothetical protein
MQRVSQAAGAVVLSVLLAVGFYYFGKSLSVLNVSKEIGLPILTIAAVVLMLAVLALVAIAYSTLGLADRTQALALPEGSVRAVIALTLILLFGILSIFLYNSMSNSDLLTMPGLTAAQKETAISLAPSGSIAIAVPETAGTFTLYLRNIRNPSSDDFAKQVMVLLGTLVTSRSSFYFGAKPAAVGVAAAVEGIASAAPTSTLTGINPNVRLRDGVPTTFTILGTNLGTTKAVKIVSGNDEVTATDVASTPTSVTCKLTVDNTLPTGAWDLVLTDASGKVARLDRALTLT